MTAIYIIAILLQAGVIIYFMRRGRKAPPQPPVADTSTYAGARKLALSITPQQLKLNIPDTETLVYGLVMDRDLGESVLTLTAYINGAANLYSSSGGSLTGGGKDPRVGILASELVTMVQEFLLYAMPVADTGLPPKGCVRFYLLTNKGTYAAQEQWARLEDNTSAWLGVFLKANDVIEQMTISNQ